MSQGLNNIEMLDGDVIRKNVSKDLGFSREERIINIQRVGSIAKDILKRGMNVICAFVSPYESAREYVRDLIGKDRFVMIYLNTPLEECIRRDVKGMYAKALRGEIKMFTGVDDPYEAPRSYDLAIDTSVTPREIAIKKILDILSLRGFIEFNRILEKLIDVTKIAGREVVRIYRKSVNIVIKKDNSPVTEADRISHEIIFEKLKNLFPDIPIVSEEGNVVPYNIREKWNLFWLIDPLDGTKELIKRNGEFTINVALVYRDRPVLGIVLVPSINLFYFAQRGKGAFKLLEDLNPECISVSKNVDPVEGARVVLSRSHLGKGLEEYMGKIRVKEKIYAGSSMKFCLIAEGKADLYPRFGPTMEWDTAAGQVILEEAGGTVMTLASKDILTYNKRELKNPPFLAGNMYLSE